MKLRQVITIKPDGSIEGLERRDGFDFKKLGKAEIQRTSEVEFDSEKQKWFVSFKHCESYPKLNWFLWCCVNNWAYIGVGKEDPYLAYFDTYEQGVQAEIKTLDFLRLNSTL